MAVAGAGSDRVAGGGGADADVAAVDSVTVAASHSDGTDYDVVVAVVAVVALSSVPSQHPLPKYGSPVAAADAAFDYSPPPATRPYCGYAPDPVPWDTYSF